MAATDQPYRNQYSLDVVFGVSSILMLLSLVWMFVQDFNREFKTEQRTFRDVEAAIGQRLALEQIPSQAEFEAARQAVEEARSEREANADKRQELRSEIAKLLPEKERAEVRFQEIKSDLESRLSFYDIEVEKHGPSSPLAQRYFKEKEQFERDLEKVQAERDDYVTKIRELRSQADAFEKNLTDKISALKKLNDRFDAQVRIAINKQWTWADSVRNLPIIDGFASPIKIHQITNNDVPIDYNFKYVTRFDRCMSCHQGIDRPAYTKENLRSLIDATSRQKEKLKTARSVLAARKEALSGLPEAAAIPDPDELKLNELSPKTLTDSRITEFAVHPRLELFVGANSKHPAERFGCSACHSGQGSATSFTLASHTPNDTEAKERWVKEHGWESIHMWDFPMLPHRFIEASCLKCHHQVTDLYGSDGRAEAPKVLRGYNLIREYGCFGCHEIHGRKGGRDIGPDLRTEPYPPLEELTASERNRIESDPDNPPGKLRKVGPSLARISEKTNADWIAKWLRAPRSFRPDTKMPHFYGLSNNHPDVLPAEQKKFPDAEIWAVTQYLLEISREHLQEAGKLHKEDAAVSKKEVERRNELFIKGKLTEEEKKELDDVQRRIRLRQVEPLVDRAPKGHKPDAAKGRHLFVERGCLACHSHQATGKKEHGSPSITSEAVFGPNLSQVAEKLGTTKGDKASARIWLTQWILDPHVHSPRSRMPVTHLDGAQAADIAEWLLSQESLDLGADWNEVVVPEPDQDTLKDLARVYLVRMLPKREINDLLDGKPISETLKKDLPRDEQDLATHFSDAALKRYVGKKAVARQGCYACHDIPGFEALKPIGVTLNDWGKKPADRLAFEDIARFLDNNHHIVDSLTDKDGKPNAQPQGKKQPYEKFYAELLSHHHRSREGYLHQKIVDPRSYDFDRVRAWDDRARMPQFKLTRIRQKEEENDADFEARLIKEEADAREAVMTFVLGLVAEQVPTKSINQPTGDRLAEVKGRQVLDNFNCAGCHLIRPGVYDFKMTKESLQVLNSKAGHAPADHVFPEHHYWTGRTPSATEKSTAYGIVKKQIPPPPGQEDDPEEPAKMRLRITLSYAMRFLDGNVYKDIQSYTNVAILSGDMLNPPPEVVRNQEALERYIAERGQFGGAFADLLTYYMHKKDPKTFARGNDGDSARARLLAPPSLIGQGERTQPEWLYQFLLNPYPIREMSALRMPKFNLANEDARALADYFGAVERMNNPGVAPAYPFEDIRQQDASSDAFFRQKTIDYVARLKATKVSGNQTAFDKKVDELTPVWQQIRKENEAQLADAKVKLEGWEARAKASKALADEAQKKLKDAGKDEAAKLKTESEKLKDVADAEQKQLDIWKQEADRLEQLVANSSVEKQRDLWAEKEAYITDAYRLVMNRTLCLQCHSIGTIETKNEIMGPNLTNAHQRLRPGWLERWVAYPQKFLPYESSMPVNFPADKPEQFSEYFVGTPRERVQAIRDLLMIVPRASALPVNRYWVLPLPGEKKS